jgi:hypothetical protein
VFDISVGRSEYAGCLFLTLLFLPAMHVSMGVVSLIYFERNRKKITWPQHCSVFCVADYEKDIQSR